MKYFAVARRRGPAWDASRPMREQIRWKEHAVFMDGLAAEGAVVLGGPLGEGERTFLLIFSMEDEGHIESRLAADPWTTAGLLEIAKIEPWEILLKAGRASSQG